jgi:type I restriction-modification system DNA methylase subunit/restriction endonuclease S subunit
MGKTYKCDQCDNKFDRKSNYEKHFSSTECVKKEKEKEIKKNKNKNKKEDVDNLNDLSYLRLPDDNIIFELKNDDNKNKSESKYNILKMIKKGHDILYNSENIVDEDALNDIMNFIFIKCIQPIISDVPEDGKIDLLNKKHYKHLLEEDDNLDRILGYFKDLTLLADSELDVIRNMDENIDAIREMGNILINHPLTRQIYTENNFIKAKKSPTIQTLLSQVICKIDIKELEQNEDVIGEIYEYMINGYSKKGSKLGQFFTPRKLMKLISQYKEHRIHEILSEIKGDIRLYDSCLGTGGWMVSGYNMLKNKYPNRLLLSGGEVKPSTFQYGLMNLILTIKKFPHEVQCESSLTHINKTKHHLIWTNPPFQTDKKFVEVEKNFKHDKYTKENKIKVDDVYLLKNNSPPIQFLELDLYKLEEKGLCMIVLPYGELFFGGSYKENRKYFMEETNITDIILFEGGIFTHTGIKTCVIIFEKDKSGTKSINFIKANKECTSLTRITTVLIDDILKEPTYSWYLRDYLKDPYIESLCVNMTGFEWVEFGDVFQLEKGKVQSSKVEQVEDGKYRIISISEKDKFTNDINNEYLISGDNVFIATTSSGTSSGPYETKIKYYSGECSYTNLLCALTIKNKYKNKIKCKYVYYYLKSIQTHIEKYYEKGACNKSLDQKNFNRMKIPIPTLQDQEKIIINVMELEELIDLNNKAKNSCDRMLTMYMEAMIKGATNKGINKIIRLGKLITYLPNGKRKSSEGSNSGLYPLYYCSINNVLYMDDYDFEDEAITMNVTNGSGKCNIFHPKGKYSVAETTLHFKSKNENIITTNILYNYLWLIKSSIANLYKGTQQMSIRQEDLNNKIMVPVPPIEYQHQMEETINKINELQQSYINTINEINKNIDTAFMNSLDSYGNPNSFNLDKLVLDQTELVEPDLIQLDEQKVEEPIKLKKVKKQKELEEPVKEPHKSKPKKVKKEKKEQNNYA